MSKNLYKRCPHCDEIKPISLFSKNKRSPDGYHYHCKDCAKSYTQKINNERPFYRMWSGMMQRCIWGENYNGKLSQDQWARYGGRGITVSEEFQDYETFADFAIELHEQFVKQYGTNIKFVLDRINADGDYERDNLRFVSEFESSMNKRERNDPYYEHMGINMPLTWWASVYKIDHQTLWRRMKQGWSLARALNEPVDNRYSLKKERQVVETTDKVELKDGVYYLNKLPITEADLCRRFEIKTSTFRARMKKYNKYSRDWTLMEALTTKA